MLDVGTAREDAFQVDPAPLDVDPYIEEGHDAVQLVFPAQGVLLENLASRRKEELDRYPFHSQNTCAKRTRKRRLGPGELPGSRSK